MTTKPSPRPPSLREKSQLMSASEIERTLVRLVHEIVEKNNGAKDLGLVGIRRRGVPMAQRLGEMITRIEKTPVPVGTLDITLYRDDLSTLGPKPVVQKLNVNATFNCLGQGAWANATLGRAMRLILQNIGGALPGEMDKATQGQPGKYSFCCAENEEASPWEPLHVERGFAKDANTVTVGGVLGTWSMNMTARKGEEVIAMIGDTMQYPASSDCGKLRRCALDDIKAASSIAWLPHAKPSLVISAPTPYCRYRRNRKT